MYIYIIGCDNTKEYSAELKSQMSGINIHTLSY